MSILSGLKPNNIGVITGSGSGGIGFAVAKTLLLQYKLKVILLDNNLNSLKQAKETLLNLNIPESQFETIECDVTSYEQVESIAKSIRKSHGSIDFLMLNSGIQIPTKNFGNDLTSWKSILDVNLYGVIHGVGAFVDAMRNQNTPGTIVITGSKQGLTNPPGNPAYNVSKAAVRSLSDNLSHSLLETKLNVHLLIPGYTFTKLTNSSGKTLEEKPNAAWTSEQVSDELFKGIQEGKYYIVCPDNDVNWKLDSARIEWSAGDILQGRKALSRWNPEYKEEFEAFIAEKTKL